MSDSARTPLLVHHLPDAPDGVLSDVELPAPSDRFVLRDGRQAWLRVRPQGAAGVLGLLVTLADDPTIIGEAGCVPRPTMLAAELALAVARSWRCQGIGSVLVEVLCRAVRHAGVGQVMATLPTLDTSALDLAERSGFTLQPHPADRGLLLAWRRLPPRLASMQAPPQDSALGPLAGWLRPSRAPSSFRSG